MLKKLIQLRVKYDSGILSPIIISFTASEGKENNSEVCLKSLIMLHRWLQTAKTIKNSVIFNKSYKNN